jgi:hypothetical protein
VTSNYFFSSTGLIRNFAAQPGLFLRQTMSLCFRLSARVPLRFYRFNFLNASQVRFFFRTLARFLLCLNALSHLAP